MGQAGWTLVLTLVPSMATAQSVPMPVEPPFGPAPVAAADFFIGNVEFDNDEDISFLGGTVGALVPIDGPWMVSPTVSYLFGKDQVSEIGEWTIGGFASYLSQGGFFPASFYAGGGARILALHFDGIGGDRVSALFLGGGVQASWKFSLRLALQPFVAAEHTFWKGSLLDDPETSFVAGARLLIQVLPGLSLRFGFSATFGDQMERTYTVGLGLQGAL